MDRKSSLSISNEPARTDGAEPSPAVRASLPLSGPVTPPVSPADALSAKVKELLPQMKIPKTDAEVTAALQISKSQAREWLRRLVKEEVLKRKQKPIRYFAPSDRQENLLGMP